MKCKGRGLFTYQSGFHWVSKLFVLYCHATWLAKKTRATFYPIRSKTKTDHNARANVFPPSRHIVLTYFLLFWLVHWILFVLCDWLQWFTLLLVLRHSIKNRFITFRRLNKIIHDISKRVKKYYRMPPSIWKVPRLSKWGNPSQPKYSFSRISP